MTPSLHALHTAANAAKACSGEDDEDVGPEEDCSPEGLTLSSHRSPRPPSQMPLLLRMKVRDEAGGPPSAVGSSCSLCSARDKRGQWIHSEPVWDETGGPQLVDGSSCSLHGWGGDGSWGQFNMEPT